MASALLAASLLVAQEPAGLGWLEGSWRGAGTMMGRPSEATLEVRPALGGRFIEFSYRAGGFEGRAFYRPAEGGRWRATWFDNRGITFGIGASVEGRTLTAEWGDADTERGRTLYRLAQDGRLQVTDCVLRSDGACREFATHILARAD